MKEKFAEERRRLGDDPDALRKEAEVAARKRGRRAPLPHRVRMTLDQRTQAMYYVVSALAGMPLPADQQDGLHQLERLVGLRSGRGGATRDLSEISTDSVEWPKDLDRLIRAVKAASPLRLEIACRSIELAVIWLPALRALYGEMLGTAAASAPLVDVIADWEESMTPDSYILLFALFVANAAERASESDIEAMSESYRPELATSTILARFERSNTR